MVGRNTVYLQQKMHYNIIIDPTDTLILYIIKIIINLYNSFGNGCNQSRKSVYLPSKELLKMYFFHFSHSRITHTLKTSCSSINRDSRSSVDINKVTFLYYHWEIGRYFTIVIMFIVVQLKQI